MSCLNVFMTYFTGLAGSTAGSRGAYPVGLGAGLPAAPAQPSTRGSTAGGLGRGETGSGQDHPCPERTAESGRPHQCQGWWCPYLQMILWNTAVEERE